MSLYYKLKALKQYLKNGGDVVVRRVTPIALEGQSLGGKTILITGATSGIGLNLASVLVKAGSNVIITGRDEGKMRDALKCLFNAKSLNWDICDTSLADTKMKEAISLFGDVDILINNAGIYDGTDVYNMTEEIFDRVISTNLKGAYFVSQAFLKNIKDDNDKLRKIINILSIRALTSSTNMYCSSKWAEKCFTDGLAKEMLARNKKVIVNGVAPGPTCSNINHINPEGNTYFSDGERVKYMLIPEEVTNVIAFLCTDLSNGIVGQTIVVDGGETIR